LTTHDHTSQPKRKAKEIAEQATQFVDFVESWIDSKFPNLKR
jgi:hypothetical protein